MHRWLRDLALCFSAGAAGAVVKGLLIWLCGFSALSAPIGSYLAAALYPLGFYQRVVWGGLYAFLFLLPLARASLLMSGLLMGVIVSLLQLLVWPLLQRSGLHGSQLIGSPQLLLSTLLLNCIWGWATALLLRWIR